MKIFIQSLPSGIPQSENCFIADKGFQEMGFETRYFSTIDDLAHCRPDDMIVGGISIVRRKLDEFGISIPKMDYPEELSPYLERRVWKTTMDQILADSENRPVFVKLVQEKRFSGMVLRKADDHPKLSSCRDNEPVYCSEVVEFLREWRVFVRYGSILDVRPYSGEWPHHYNSQTIEMAVADFASAPAGYAMDFGVTADGRTLLVEVNDGYSIGCYGLKPIDYAKLLSARWCGLVGIHDECDTFMERYEWRAHRRG